MKPISDKTVKKAVNGKVKHKKHIFDTYKTDLYHLCTLLIDDEKSVNDVMEKTFTDIWKKAELKSIVKIDEFRTLLFLTACKNCRQRLFGKDADVFKVKKAVTVTYSGFEESEFTGDSVSAVEYLKNALDNLEPKQKFVYISMKICNFSFKEIASIIRQREIVAMYYHDCAVLELQRELSESDLTIEKVSSLLEKSRPDSVPADTEEICTNAIKKKRGKK